MTIIWLFGTFRETFNYIILFQAKEHEIETKKAMKKLLHGNLTVGKMEEKLKVSQSSLSILLFSLILFLSFHCVVGTAIALCMYIK